MFVVSWRQCILLIQFQKGWILYTILQIFYEVNKNGLLRGLGSNGINEFVSKSLQCVWLMKVQDPPVVLLWAEQDKAFDKNRFSYYTKKGNTVAQAVWPAVLLYTGGPLVVKGIAQGK